MSCWRTQIVLRMPVKTIGIRTEEQWERFEALRDSEMNWNPGCFAPALTTKRHGRFLDCFLEDTYPVLPDDRPTVARPLTTREKERYLPAFQAMFPGFTMKQMDSVHYCAFTWYDGTDAPFCY